MTCSSFVLLQFVWRRSSAGRKRGRANHRIGRAIRASNSAHCAGHVGANAGCTACDAVLRHGTVAQE